jgi:hypothetical protein
LQFDQRVAAAQVGFRGDVVAVMFDGADADAEPPQFRGSSPLAISLGCGFRWA